jgi:membrane peptidoglycan carboxypeptidase
MKFITTDSLFKGRNLPAVRTLQKIPGSFLNPDKYEEKISFLGLEGSSVTLLGLVKYDSVNNYFHLTQLSAIIAGGVKECKILLK